MCYRRCLEIYFDPNELRVVDLERIAGGALASLSYAREIIFRRTKGVIDRFSKREEEFLRAERVSLQTTSPVQFACSYIRVRVGGRKIDRRACDIRGYFIVF